MRALSPDVVVCSGDLLDYPAGEEEDPCTRELARRDLATVAEALGAVGRAYLVIPGNHDHPDLTWEAFPDAPRDVVIGGLRFLVFDDREGVSHVPHRTGAERRRLDGALADARSAPQVHVQHYLVWPERNEGYPHTYADGEELTEMIVRSGIVRLVLSGHYHPGLEPERVGDTWFATAPAFCEAPHRFWVYDLEGTELRWRAVEVAAD